MVVEKDAGRWYLDGWYTYREDAAGVRDFVAGEKGVRLAHLVQQADWKTWGIVYWSEVDLGMGHGRWP